MGSDLSIASVIVLSKKYHKRDDLNFEIVNYPYLDGDFLALLMMYIFHNLFSLKEYDNQFLTIKLLKLGYQYDKLHEAFSKF